MGSSETQYLTETERQQKEEGGKAQRREGARERKKGKIVAKRREISEVRTNVIKHVYKNVIMKAIIYNLLNAYDNKKLKSWKTKQEEEDFYKALDSLSMKIKTLK